jgi:hypothetical protein
MRKQMKVRTGGSRVVEKVKDQDTRKKAAKKSGKTKLKGEDNVS